MYERRVFHHALGGDGVARIGIVEHPHHVAFLGLGGGEIDIDAGGFPLVGRNECGRLVERGDERLMKSAIPRANGLLIAPRS
jgi:hypothetical protein